MIKQEKKPIIWKFNIEIITNKSQNKKKIKTIIIDPLEKEDVK